jgi:hypothetical protein
MVILLNRPAGIDNWTVQTVQLLVRNKAPQRRVRQFSTDFPTRPHDLSEDVSRSR